MKKHSLLATSLALFSTITSSFASAEDLPYLKRYAPEPNFWELGLFGGVMFPSENHQLYQPDRGPGVQQRFKTSGELGVRFAYYPLAFVGAEIEAAAMPSEQGDGQSAGLWAARGHVIGQLPLGSINPFLLVGGGALGAGSESMGSDVDQAFHFGGGVKAAIDERLLFRLDVRDTLHRDFTGSSGTPTHSPEILLGLSFTPVRRNPDADGDGFLDYRDECPNQAGEVRGCPAPVPDQDGDGVLDEADQCIDAAGAAPTGCPDGDGDGVLDKDDACPELAGSQRDGCPPKPCVIPDSDGDGLLDSVDECPNEAARTANGCVVKDKDGDGIDDAKDKCPADPETQNNFEDEDGCPDVVPEKVKKFSGVIPGIEFDKGLATIKKGSEGLIREAGAVLKEYPNLRIRVVGHTDDTGDADENKKLSEARAQSVKDFLVAEGIAAERVEVRGAGPTMPIADNKTNAGRQKNRRIEFELIH